jgi:hypothetical protein
MLPAPLRIAAAIALAWLPALDTKLPAVTVLLAAQAHALALHAPSLWSSRVHRSSCLLLTERILYYCVMQCVVVQAVAWFRPQLELHMTACYCSLYYAWDIGRLTLAHQRGTLAPFCLIGSLLLFACLTLPYFHHRCGAGTNGATEHLLAWTIADSCHFVASRFFLI